MCCFVWLVFSLELWGKHIRKLLYLFFFFVFGFSHCFFLIKLFFLDIAFMCLFSFVFNFFIYMSVVPEKDNHSVQSKKDLHSMQSKKDLHTALSKKDMCLCFVRERQAPKLPEKGSFSNLVQSEEDLHLMSINVVRGSNVKCRHEILLFNKCPNIITRVRGEEIGHHLSSSPPRPLGDFLSHLSWFG